MTHDCQTPLKLTSTLSGYRQRTLDNAREADATVAFAIDYSSAGERLTAAAAGATYLAASLDTAPIIAARLVYRHLKARNGHHLNIAGNSLHTLARHGLSQDQVNAWVHQVIAKVHEHWPLRIVRSGGQTGVDTAGLVSAVALGIPAVGHYPQGYLRRSAAGKDFQGDPRVIAAEIRGMAEILLSSNTPQFNRASPLTEVRHFRRSL